MLNRIERPRSLTELVYEALKREIVSGELKMGEILSEARTASRLEVSRTPIREAFHRLELEGLVTTQPQVGTFVFSLGPDALRDICDTRVCLEQAAMRTGYEKDRKRLAKRLGKIVRKMNKARADSDDQRYLSLDTDFHQTLFDCADNTYLNDAYQTIASKMAALRNRLGDHPDHMAKSFGEHRQMVQLLEASQLDHALELLIAHIGRKEGSYWDQ